MYYEWKKRHYGELETVDNLFFIRINTHLMWPYGHLYGKIIQEKDYICNPKKSGYSAYHLIVETPVTINSETVIIKVEIQIRTIAMDFWSEMEHDIRYKTNNQVSKFDSKKLTWYAKALENLQAKIIKLYRKQENNSMFNY